MEKDKTLSIEQHMQVIYWLVNGVCALTHAADNTVIMEIGGYGILKCLLEMSGE